MLLPAFTFYTAAKRKCINDGTGKKNSLSVLPNVEILLVIWLLAEVLIEAGTVCYISMEFFQSTLRINTDFTLKLLALFANELQVSEKRMRNLAHMSVKGRVAHAILSLKRQFGVDESV
jgi:hypothetical protein